MSSSPSAIIHASCSATLAVSPGLRRLELQALEFPSLLLSVAMVDEHSDGMQHVAQDVNAGALMGVSHVSLHSQRTARLELTAQVGQASMWASSNRLCIAAGFVMSAAGSIAGLLGEITHLNRKVSLRSHQLPRLKSCHEGHQIISGCADLTHVLQSQADLIDLANCLGCLLFWLAFACAYMRRYIDM